jgi:hypothetical protein
MSLDDLVATWLRELEQLLPDLPVVQRRELLRDLEAHIASERDDRPGLDETGLLEILERLGDPQAIAAAAYEEAGLGQTEGRAFAAAVLTAATELTTISPARWSGRAVVITPAPPVLDPKPEAWRPPAAEQPSPCSGRAYVGGSRPGSAPFGLPPAPPPPLPPRWSGAPGKPGKPGLAGMPWGVVAAIGAAFFVVVMLVGCAGTMLLHTSPAEPASGPVATADPYAPGPQPAEAGVDELPIDPVDPATVVPDPADPETVDPTAVAPGPATTE